MYDTIILCIYDYLLSFIIYEVAFLSNLLILGAGQYGGIVYDIAKSTEQFEKIDFLDDLSDKAIGKISDAAKFSELYKYAVVAMGNPDNRLRLLNELTSLGFEIPVLCSPRAYIAPSSHVAYGSIIEPMAVIQSNAKIEKGCLICAGAVVNHDALVKEGCQIDCNAVVPSSQVVPECTKLPCGCVFFNN